MLPPLKTLPVFIAVAEHLSFSKAAEQLHVTHSAVSQSIRSLENYLGHSLFDRSSSKVSLNSQGEKYYLGISPALRMISDSTKQQLSLEKENVLTIKVISTLTLLWFIPRLPKLNALYPEIDLRLSSLAYEPTDFDCNTIDAAIVYGVPSDWPGLVAEKLFDDALVLVGNKQHIQAAESVAEVIRVNKVIYVDAELRKSDWPQWCEAGNIEEPSKAKRIVFQTTAQALQAAVSGVGVMVTHKPFVQDLLKSGQLSLFGGVEQALEKSYYLVCKTEAAKNLYFQKLLDWILSEK